MSPELEELVRNWVTKAENDLKAGEDELRTAEPATDTVCFHRQQCAEKYLKAYLTLKGKPFRRTHDIAELIEACKEIDSGFEDLYELEADHLTVYGVEIRYPDDFYMPGRDEAEHCLRIAMETRDFVRDWLSRG